MEKLEKSHSKTIDLKYQLQHVSQILAYLIHHILHHILNIILNISKEKRKKTDNPSVRIYVNKIENIITLKIKSGYYL